MKQKLIRLCSTFFALISIVSIFGACSPKIELPPSSSVSSEILSSSEPESSRVYQIGLVQYSDHTALEVIREAFMARIESWGYDESKISIEMKNANGDTNEISTICKTFVDQKVDLIVAISTPAAKAAIAATKDTNIKVLYAGVSNPEIDLGLTQPSASITGIADVTASYAIIDLARKILPHSKSVGILYDPNEPNALGNALLVKQFCEEQELSVVEELITDTAQIADAAKRLCDEVDFIYLPPDNVIAGYIKEIAEISREKKKAVFSSASSFVQDGILASISVDYVELGAQTADMAIELAEGRSITEIAPVKLENHLTYINQTTQVILKLSFPDDLAKKAVYFQ